MNQSAPDNPTAALRPTPAVADTPPYRVPQPAERIDLRLDGNEGVAPPADLLALAASLGPEILRTYPNKAPLEAALAQRFGVASEQVLVTAGGDEALDRACRSVLMPGRNLVLPVPTFEMLERYPALMGAAIKTVPWPDQTYPTDAVLGACDPDTSAIAVVSPNNPTGAIATADTLRRLATTVPSALLIVDLAYGEFADEDLTPVALELPNAVVVRTFSKAWGLAGLRVGYAIGPTTVINWMRAAGSPYPTSGLSLALARRRLETGADDMTAFVAEIRRERATLIEQLARCGGRPRPSQGNFVLAHFRDAERIWRLLGATGIAVRHFAGRPGLEDALRITCPGSSTTFDRLTAAIDDIHTEAPDTF